MITIYNHHLTIYPESGGRIHVPASRYEFNGYGLVSVHVAPSVSEEDSIYADLQSADVSLSTCIPSGYEGQPHRVTFALRARVIRVNSVRYLSDGPGEAVLELTVSSNPEIIHPATCDYCTDRKPTHRDL